MEERSRSPSKWEMRRPLSQYWEALGSETRFSVAVEGALRSVHNTGSQITNTRMFRSPSSFKNFSNAEAPCKHTAHVGESIMRTRTEFAEPLNASFNDERLELFRLTSGCCPFGAKLPPYR